VCAEALMYRYHPQTRLAQRLVEQGSIGAAIADLPRSPRTAYIGIDNRAAGATAAYLITQWLGRRPGAVLVTLSRSFFRGDEEREMGFRSGLRSMQPSRRAALRAGDRPVPPTVAGDWNCRGSNPSQAGGVRRPAGGKRASSSRSARSMWLRM
jgi:DNA-binding LacI/PurR family transcriptional regulator